MFTSISFVPQCRLPTRKDLVSSLRRVLSGFVLPCRLSRDSSLLQRALTLLRLSSVSRSLSTHHRNWSTVSVGSCSHRLDLSTRLRRSGFVLCHPSLSPHRESFPHSGMLTFDSNSLLSILSLTELREINGHRELRILNPWRRAKREAQDRERDGPTSSESSYRPEDSGLDGGSWTAELRDSLSGVGEDGEFESFDALPSFIFLLNFDPLSFETQIADESFSFGGL